jgi:hypothetical protein
MSFRALPSEIPSAAAVQAHAGISHVPEQRAQGVQQEYANHLNGLYASLAEEVGEDPARLALLVEEMERYRTAYRQHVMAWLGARGRTVSPMIVGPSKFPVARNAKRLETERRRAVELAEFQARALKAIRRKLFPERGAVGSDDLDALDHLRARLEERREKQERMKAVNRLVRAHRGAGVEEMATRLREALGLDDEAARAIATARHATGYHGWELSNNNGEIRRLEGRIRDLEKRADTPTREEDFAEHGGGKIVDNREANRVQVVFNDWSQVPEPVRAALKRRGFVFSRAWSAWQRARSIPALSDARWVVRQGESAAA